MPPNKQPRRPGPPLPPPVWAETRQELAETLPYYRAYQQGSYNVGPYHVAPDLAAAAGKKGKGKAAADRQVEKDITPYAYLLGGFGSPRDQWADGGRVVISHGGGHAAAAEPVKKKVKKKGRASTDVDMDLDGDAAGPSTSAGLTLASSQSRHDPRIAALLSSCKHGIPIVLIMGENYPLADFELNCGFAVLGWYRITHCWAEKEGEGVEGLVRWKMRFEWEEAQGRPWWLPLPLSVDGRTSGRVWNPRARLEVCGKCSLLRRSSAAARPAKTQEEVAVTTTGAAEPDAQPGSPKRKRRSRASKDLRKRLRKREPGQLVTVKHGPVRQDATTTAGCTTATGIISKVCPHCKEASPQVYEAGWTCLVPECSQGFWRFSAEALSRSNAFEVVQSFLQASPAETSKASMLPFPLQPQEEDAFDVGAASRGASSGGGGSEEGLKGHFCKQCHRLSCREYLAFHRCAHCGMTTQLQQQGGSNEIDGASSRVPPPLASVEDALLYDAVVNAKFDITVTRRIIVEGAGNSSKAAAGTRFEVLTYEFPPVFLDSKVHLVQPCAEPTWADDADTPVGDNGTAHHGEALNRDHESDRILDLLLQSSLVPTTSSSPTAHLSLPPLPPLPLRRHELTMHRSTAGSQGHKARLLTQMFTANVGEAYKHSTATETMPWEKAPEGVGEAKELLERRTGWCVMGRGEEPRFNEVYPCYYAEGMRMNYHDDGEPGLGPLVSSLSLGPTSAIMNFRLKRKFLELPPLPPPDSVERPPTIRRAYNDLQRRALYAWATSSSVGKTDRVALSLPLRHGSVVVQEGRALQECFEHAVLPTWDGRGAREGGGGRFGVTARSIGPKASDGGVVVKKEQEAGGLQTKSS